MKTFHIVLLAALLAVPAFGQDQPGPAPAQRGKRNAFAPAAGSAASRIAAGRGGPGAVAPAGAQAGEEPGHAADVAGQWKGIYIADATIMLMDLEIKAAEDGRSFTGEIHFVTMYDAVQRRFTRPAEGSWGVEGKYFPGSHTIALTPTGWIKHPTQVSPVPQPMGGVYSEERKELAGQLESRFPGAGGGGSPMPYFVFARAEDGSDGAERITKLADHLASWGTVAARPNRAPARARDSRAGGEAGSGGGGAADSGGGSPAEPAPAPAAVATAPDDDALIAWTARYDQEYPGSGATGYIDKICNQALPLLDDAAFKPVFGDTYDAIDYGVIAKAADRFAGRITRVDRSAEIREMLQEGRERARAATTPEERAAINKDMQQQIQAMRTGDGSKPNPQLTRQLGYMQYVLKPAAAKFVSVAAMRTLDAWEAETLARFSSEAPTATTYTDMAAAEQAMNVRMTYAWPSERARVVDQFEQLRTKLAGPALAANADRAISAAGGLAGAKALAGWAKENQGLLDHASPEERAATVARVDEALDKLLEEQLAGPLAELDKIGSGMDAINRAAVWYRDFQPKFAFASDRPPVVAALGKLPARRPADLAGAQDQMIGGLSDCTQTAQVDEMTARELSIPGDNQTSAYPLIMAAAEARKKKIEEDALLATFSQGERDLMDRPGHLDLSKAKDFAPSAEEVRLAVLRAYAANEGGKMIDAHTAHHVERAASPYLIPYPFNVTITDEKITRFMELPDTRDYQCGFKIVMKVEITNDNIIANYDENTRKGSDQMAALANKLGKMMGDEERIMVFRLYDDGWGVVGARDGAAIEDAMAKAIIGR